MNVADVPVIDIAGLAGFDAMVKNAIAAQIDSACRGAGFFYAANHGLDLKALQGMTMDWHHAMSVEEKKELAIHAYNQASPRHRSGYYMAIEGRKANESFCYLNPAFSTEHPAIVDALPAHEVNVWPDPHRHPGMREFYEAYYRDVSGVAALILRGFAIALGREERFFEPHFSSEDTLSAVSLIRYPYLEDYPPVKVAPDGTRLSFESHQDVSLITVLYQTAVPNLQVKTAEGFLDIPVADEHLLINCGTYMAYITYGYYPAPEHRVKFINAERLSIPFFVNLSHSSAIVPFDVAADGPAEVSAAVPYGHYLKHGLAHLIRSNGQT
ncbi:isopenicillin N synthase family oxygenase [Luteimonas sp. XNQY3]|nr:2OG-Fe(II) oxygenase family protein [Luteimonas sp. XNQY3]MCD9006279.1 isopenicillin N synthase family oxygenase [Luteimonas sp. XNQY3]